MGKELAAKASDVSVTLELLDFERFDLKMIALKMFGYFGKRAQAQVLVKLVVFELVHFELVRARARQDLHLALVLFKALRKQHPAECARGMHAHKLHAHSFVYDVCFRHV